MGKTLTVSKGLGTTKSESHGSDMDFQAKEKKETMMTKTSRLAFVSTLFCLAAAGAYALAPLPMLRVMQITGKLQVTTDRTQDLPQGELQYIPSGSHVQIESGAAWFESQGHVMIRATEGDSFLFTAADSDAGSPTMIQALGGSATSLDVYVGSLKYLLRDSGAVSIFLTGEGGAMVQVDGGKVTVEPGSVLRAGESLSFRLEGRSEGGMAAGDSATVDVPTAPGFMGVPIAAASIKVTQLGDSTLDAERIQPGDAVATAVLPEEQGTEIVENQELKAEEDLRSAVANTPAKAPAKMVFPEPQAPLFSPAQDVIARPAAQAQPSLWERVQKSDALLWGSLAGLLAIGVFLILRRG